MHTRHEFFKVCMLSHMHVVLSGIPSKIIDVQGGGNPFANMGNMLEQMKKAQQLVQVEAAQVQTELAQTDFEGYSTDETVRVVMSGNQEPRSVDFTDEALEQGPDVSHCLHVHTVCLLMS